MVSSRSGLVDSKATGQPINSSIRRTYLIACAGNCAQERASRGGLVPALGGLVDRLDSGLGVLARRKIVDFAAVEAIADAELDLVEAVEDVELGQSDALDAAGADRLPHQHGVEPAAAARPAGDDAELLALGAERLADLVELLGRERPGADPRRVGLADAEHVADRVRAEARAGRRLRRHRVRRGDVRIGAVVDVEQRALRALEQDAPALAPLFVEQRPHRVHVGQHLGRHRGELVVERARRDLVHAEPAAQRIVMRQQAVDLAVEHLQIGKIHQPDRAAADLVLIGRADAAAGGADRALAGRLLARDVELLVQRQDQRRVLGDAQVVVRRR